MIRIALFSALILTSLAFTSCDKCKADGVNVGCICTLEYAPVCGCDGVTYDNSCRAECVGVDYDPGEC